MLILDKIKENRPLQLALILCGFIAALTLLYFFAGRPALNYNNKLKKEFGEGQKQLLEAEALIRSFPNPQKEMKDLEKRAQELRDIGATTKQLPRLIQSLAVPANNLNINITSIRQREDLRPGSEVLPAGVNKIYIEVAMKCPYQLFAQYLKAVSELPTSFIVERLDMDKGASEEETPSEGKKVPEKEAAVTLSINLLLSTYMIWEI